MVAYSNNVLKGHWTMARLGAAAGLYGLMLMPSVQAHAEQGTADRARLMYAARSVCTAVIAKFAETPDPDAPISYDQGNFKVVRAKGGITILENNATIAQLPKFDYGNFTDCLSKMVGDTK
jgi:hypothetical protein